MRIVRCRGLEASTPSYAVYMAYVRKLRREVVEAVSVPPSPFSKISGLPEPPQSSTSSRTLGSTLTNCRRCGDGSRQTAGSCAKRKLVKETIRTTAQPKRGAIRQSAPPTATGHFIHRLT